MKITDIDYYSVYGESWLNKLPVNTKLLAVGVVLTVVIIFSNIFVLGPIYITLLLIIIAASALPRKNIIKMSLYPLIFLVFYFVSIKNLSLELAFIFIFKALSASTALILLVFTTNYTKIFGTLKNFMPGFLVSALLLTYRSIFILARTLENLLEMTKFRGEPNLKSLGNLVGFFVIKSIQTGENMYDAMKLRGYDDKTTAN